MISASTLKHDVLFHKRRGVGLAFCLDRVIEREDEDVCGLTRMRLVCVFVLLFFRVSV